MKKTGRFIISETKLDDLELACSALRWLVERPGQKDAIISYNIEDRRGRDGKIEFYVKRNKSSITVTTCEQPDYHKDWS